MKGLFGAGKKDVFAIEIGDCFLKIAFGSSPDSITFDYQQITNLDSRDISEAIKNICRKKNIKSSSGVLCFPRNRTTIGTLHLPSTDKREIAQMVKVHAASQVPYPKEEITADWRVVMCDKEGYADVILVILQKTLISKYFGIVSAAGIEIKEVVVAPEGVLGWFFSRPESRDISSKTFILLNIDYDFTDFLLCSGKKIIASHLIARGQKDFALSESSKDSFIGEFKQALGVAPSVLSEEKGNDIFICGTDKSFPSLKETLEKEFSCRVQEVRPKKPLSEEVSFIPLLGIAQKEIPEKFSLSIPEIEIKKEWKQKLRRGVFVGGLIAYIAAMLIASFSTQVYKQTKYLKELRLKNKHLKSESESLETAFRKIRLIEAIRNPGDSFIYYLNTVSAPVPEGCNLKEIIFVKREKITVKGEALRMSDIFDFISQLENSGVFSEVETRHTRKLKGDKENKSEFEIICYMKL